MKEGKLYWDKESHKFKKFHIMETVLLVTVHNNSPRILSLKIEKNRAHPMVPKIKANVSNMMKPYHLGAESYSIPIPLYADLSTELGAIAAHFK